MRKFAGSQFLLLASLRSFMGTDAFRDAVDRVWTRLLLEANEAKAKSDADPSDSAASALYLSRSEELLMIGELVRCGEIVIDEYAAVRAAQDPAPAGTEPDKTKLN